MKSHVLILILIFFTKISNIYGISLHNHHIENFPHISRSNRDHNSALSFRGGGGNQDDFDDDLGHSDLILGKDRILLQFNIDLKSLFRKVLNRNQWILAWNHLIDLFANLQLLKSQRRKVFKRNAISILSDIRSRKSNDNIFDSSYNIFSTSSNKLTSFLGTIDDCLVYAMKRKKFIVLYVEDNHVDYPTKASVLYRKALSDLNLAQYMNDNNIFYITTTKHRDTKLMFQKLNINEKDIEYPLFAIINPFLEQDDIEFERIDKPPQPNAPTGSLSPIKSNTIYPATFTY
jgi:hypothetical protein